MFMIDEEANLSKWDNLGKIPSMRQGHLCQEAAAHREPILEREQLTLQMFPAGMSVIF